jgi:hypothetical protein
MQVSSAVDQPNPLPLRGAFSAVVFFLALALGPAVGLIWGWAANAVQFYVSPFLLFPIVVGVFAGLTVVGLARFGQVGHRPTILMAALLAAGVAAVAQHYLDYLATYSPSSRAALLAKMTREVPGIGEALRREACAENLKAISQQFTPSFGEYLVAQARRGRPLPGGYVASGWAAWLSWAVDAALTLAAAVVVTLPAVRIPYCNRCHTWYRTIRNGKIDVDTARRLAVICNADVLSDPRSPRYRLSCCQGGCGPTRCELSWEEAGGTVDLVRVWLDGEQRDQVVAALDELVRD